MSSDGVSVILTPQMVFCNSGLNCGPSRTSQYVIVSFPNPSDHDDFRRRIILINPQMSRSFGPRIDDFVEENASVFQAEIPYSKTSGITYFDSNGSQRDTPLRPYTKCHLRLTYCVSRDDMSSYSFYQWLGIEVHAV